MSRVRIALVVLCALSALLGPAGSSAAQDTTSDLIVARTEPTIVLIWRTNAALDALGARHLTGKALYNAFLAQAEDVLASHVPPSAPAGRIATLRLVYFHDADDPRYKIETLAGIDTLGTLSARAGDLRAYRHAWQRSLGAGRTPAALTASVARDEVERAVTR